MNSLDVVASEGQNFEALQALHGHDLANGVGGQRQLLAVFELVDFIIELFDRVRQLAP